MAINGAYHYFGQDLVLSSTGDLLVISGAQLVQQRILRRLMTNPGAYLWDLTYGAGLPSKVGQKVNAAAIAAIVRQQIFSEGTVASVPPPQITVTSNPNGTVQCNITYTDQITQQLVELSFPFKPTYSGK